MGPIGRTTMRSVALLVFSVLCAPAQPNSNWSTAFVDITAALPFAPATYGIHGAKALLDGYVYISSDWGTVRALTSCVHASPTDSSCWTDISSGLPGSTGTHPSATAFSRLPSGAILGAFGSGASSTFQMCAYSSSTWTCTGGSPFTQTSSAGRPQGLTLDSAGNAYVCNNFPAQVYKGVSPYNTSGSWSLISATSGGVPAILGEPSGATLNVRSFGDKIYTGGEFSGSRFATDFTSPEVIFQNGTFSGDWEDALTDTPEGSATAPTSYVVAVYGTISSITRWDIMANTKATLSGVILTSYGCAGCSTAFWQYFSLAPGTTTSEMYTAGGSTSAGVGGVLGSVDGGATWQVVGPVSSAALTTCVTGNCPARITVSPTNDDKYMTASTRRLFFHPGVTATSSGSRIGGLSIIGGKAIVH